MLYVSVDLCILKPIGSIITSNENNLEIIYFKIFKDTIWKCTNIPPTP